VRIEKESVKLRGPPDLRSLRRLEQHADQVLLNDHLAFRGLPPQLLPLVLPSTQDVRVGMKRGLGAMWKRGGLDAPNRLLPSSRETGMARPWLNLRNRDGRELPDAN